MRADEIVNWVGNCVDSQLAPFAGPVYGIGLLDTGLLGNGRAKGFLFFLARVFGQLILDACDECLG